MLWNAHNGSIPIGDTKMAYASFGYGGKRLVLLPGLSDGLSTVKGKALLLAMAYRRFSERYTVFFFSRKDRMPKGYSIREMAADQAAAMQALGMEGSCVMGVSQGGMIAQYLTIDHPELVEKLVIAVSAPQVNQRIQTCVTGWIEMARAGEHKRLMVDTAEKSYSSAYLKKYRKLYPIIGGLGKPKSYGRFLINANAILGFHAREELGRIACPTLILAGGEDQIVGVQAAREMHERIAGSQLWIYPGLGHAAYEEAPDFQERVFRFLESEAPSPERNAAER